MGAGLRKVVGTTLALTIVLLLTLSATTTLHAQVQPEVKWDIPHYNNTGHFLILRLQEFADGLAKRTNGKFTITVHPGESLLKGKQIAPALLAGRISIGPVQNAYADDLFIIPSVTNLPFLLTSTDELRTLAAKEYRDYFAKLLDEKGLKMLMAYGHPPLQVFTRSAPMDTVDAWRGNKIRIFTSMMADVCTALKAAPMAITYSEVFTALQRGTIDGYFTSINSHRSAKLYEVSKYVNMWGYSGGDMEYMSVNKNAWEKLPKNYQQAVLDVVREEQIEEKIWSDLTEADQESLGFIKTKGVDALYPTKAEMEKIRKVTLPIWDQWAAANEKVGARDILEKMKKSIAAYRVR